LSNKRSSPQIAHCHGNNPTKGNIRTRRNPRREIRASSGSLHFGHFSFVFLLLTK